MRLARGSCVPSIPARSADSSDLRYHSSRASWKGSNAIDASNGSALMPKKSTMSAIVR